MANKSFESGANRGPAFIPQRPSVIPHTPQPPTVTRGPSSIPSEEKSVVHVSSIAAANQLVQRAAHVERSVRVEPVVSASGLDQHVAVAPTASAPPLLFALWLFGPAATPLREFVVKASAFLNRATGSLAEMVLFGDPRHTADAGREALKAAGLDLSLLARDWDALLADRGSAEVVENHLTEAASRAQGVTLEQLPCIVILSASGKVRQRVSIPSAIWSNSEAAADFVKFIAVQLSAEAIELAHRRARHEAHDAATDAADRVQAFIMERGRSLSWQERALLLLSSGFTVKEVAERVGKDRSSLYADKAVKAAIDHRRASQRAAKLDLPRGTKLGGVTDALSGESDDD